MCKRYLISAIFLSIIFSCSNEKTEKMIYKVSPISEVSGFSNEWEDPVWKVIQYASINNYMGDKPGHFPKTRVKVA